MLIPAAPGYDAWAWLIWGRELWDGVLSTAEGPAWKPLPVAVTALLAPFGDGAPALWLVVARTGAIAAVALSFVVGHRLAAVGSDPHGSARGSDPMAVGAGLAAAGAVLLTGGFVRHAAVGDAEPLLVALALGAFHRALAGRHRQALALAVLAGLVRPEVWPFLGLYGLWLARHHPALRPALAALALAIPALWFVPEWLSSGELLRSTERARIPNPGQPATADLPALETLSRSLSVLFVPAAALALFTKGPARLAAAGGAAWILLVAAMSQAGFSGEERYVLPGAAILAAAGATTLARIDRRALVAAAAVLLGLAALPRLDAIADLEPRLAHQHELAETLDDAIQRAGGRDAILACGTPAVGRYRGTLLAYHLDIEKRLVRADGKPGDVTFRSRLTEHASLSPPGPPPRSEPWDVTYRPGSSCTRDRTGAKRSPSRATRSSTWSAVNTSSEGSSASWHARTSSHVTGVDTVGRSLARSE